MFKKNYAEVTSSMRYNHKTDIYISVVIATFNRCEFLKDIIDSMLKQDIKIPYEIIIVDNNSTDNTKNLVYSYINMFHGKLRYMFQPKQGKSYALNGAIYEARGNILVFTDDDVVASDGWLSCLYALMIETGCDGVGGRVLPLYPKNTPQWVKDNGRLLAGPIVMYDYGEHNIKYDKRHITPFIGANMAFTKEVLFQAGLFRTDIGPGMNSNGEDVDLFRRVSAISNKLYYCGLAHIWHKVEKGRMRLRYIARWCINSGKYDAVINVCENEDTDYVYYLGFPRYLLRNIFLKIIGLIPRILNRGEFLKQWIALFHDIGVASGYKINGACNKISNFSHDNKIS